MARRADADFSDIDLNKDSKKLLSALLARETFKPNPSLGGSVLNGLAMGLMGLNEKWDEERNDSSLAAAAKALSSGAKPLPGSVSPAITSAPDVQVPAPGTVAGSPQEHINNTWGGLTPQGRDVATRTVLGEASNQGPVGMQAVADVLRNRALQGGYRTGSQGPTTMDRVALAPGQFEPHMTQGGRDRMEAYSANSPLYQTAQGAVDTAAIGGQPDVTGGATHFYSPQAQAALGRKPPAWDDGTGRDIGGHRFFGPQQAPTQVAQADPLQRMIQSDMPRGVQRAGNRAIIQRELRTPEYETKEVNGLLYQIDKSGRTPPRLISPGGEQGAIDFKVREKTAINRAEAEEERRQREALSRPNRVQTSNRMIDDIDRATAVIDESPSTSTGPVGQVTKGIGWTPANKLNELMKPIKANIGFEELNQMRQESPTGGALGQVAVQELEYLQARRGSLDISQKPEELKKNLKRLRDDTYEVVHYGLGKGPRKPDGSILQIGEEVGDYAFQPAPGNFDPKNRNNWKRVR
jgi:hypothetical protein